jgi:hypothetical protein
MPHEESANEETSKSLDKKDEQVLAEKSQSGEISGNQQDIDPVTMELDHGTFPELQGDREGDKVVLVLVGTVTSYSDDSCAVEFDKGSIVHGKLPPLGSGERFKNLEHKLESEPGVTDAGGLAAYIGRKKYGKAKFNKLSQNGRK